MLRSFDPPAQVLKTLLCLRIQEVELKKDVDDTAPKKKFMNNKEKKQNLSRMKRKVKAWCDQLRVPAVSLSSHVSVCVCVCSGRRRRRSWRRSSWRPKLQKTKRRRSN